MKGRTSTSRSIPRILGGFAETVTELADYEKAGLDIVFVPEAYSFDAVSQLGFIAAKTEAATRSAQGSSSCTRGLLRSPR